MPALMIAAITALLLLTACADDSSEQEVAVYWFTASTSFANPAVTLARAASNTFVGIRPTGAPAFVVAQVFGAFAATAVFRWLTPTLPERAEDVVVTHDSAES